MSAAAAESVRLRDAEPADWRAVAELHIASWRDAYRGILSDAYLDGQLRADREAVWKGRLVEPISPDQVTVVGERPGAGLAAFCCILGGHDSRWGSLIDNLHVAPGLSRRGLGLLCLATAAARMPARFAATPLYLTVFEKNARARAAYERWGGTLLDELDHIEPDGARHRLRRYGWASPADLARRLDAGA